MFGERERVQTYQLECKWVSHLCGVEVLSAIGSWDQMQDLIIAIVAHLNGIPLIACHHFLPFILAYIWEEQKKRELKYI